MPASNVSLTLPPPGGRRFSLARLHSHNGVVRSTVYISVLGHVYDCTPFKADFYGPGKAYHLFAGRDITYSLLIMSLKKSDVDVFAFDVSNLPGLSPPRPELNLACLAEWVGYFDATYGAPIGYLVLEGGVQYGLSFTDLPAVVVKKQLGAKIWGGGPELVALVASGKVDPDCYMGTEEKQKEKLERKAEHWEAAQRQGVSEGYGGCWAGIEETCYGWMGRVVTALQSS